MPANTESTSPPSFTKPGLHSHNITRKTASRPKPRGPLHWLRLLFLLLGLGGISYYGYTLANEHVYQAYQNWAFDQGIAGQPGAWQDWVLQTTPLGKWMGYRSQSAAVEPNSRKPSALPEGAIIGRVSIPRLNLSAVVREGVTEQTLSQAVGHVPSTDGPGAMGNFAIAAHRDTLFRGLKDIRIGDLVSLRADENTFTYRVRATRIVQPSDVSVLEPQGNAKLLTMITCYPFYYVGSAPKRFIVTAELASQEPSTQATAAAHLQ